jgi:hypothetical protein
VSSPEPLWCALLTVERLPNDITDSVPSFAMTCNCMLPPGSRLGHPNLAACEWRLATRVTMWSVACKADKPDALTCALLRDQSPRNIKMQKIIILLSRLPS